MESNTRRSIRNGTQFDHMFPKPGAKDLTIKKNAGVEDTVKLIRHTVPRTRWQTENIARHLKGGTLRDTCANIWRFVYEHIQYKRDKDGVEQVRSPRRTWAERFTGVDCDCYTEFISSILFNLDIPHIYRITKYPKRFPEIPRWQHIYPIVPLNGFPDGHTTRSDYIVLDCVKDNFDEEQPFLECKDYHMQLDYLDGFDGPGRQEDDEDEVFEYAFDTVDAQGLAELYGDELGFLKKLVKGVKKVAKKVGKAVTKVVKKVADKVGDGVRFLNRYTNPATILLRNGFLLAMKIDMMNVAEKLRYAYLTDEQAKAMGMSPGELKKLRKVKDKAETVYWQAGGLKENLKKAILGGKGNKDKRVQVSGLYGPDDNVYADQDEYDIIHMDVENLQGLGEIASGTAMAAATGAVSAIALALKDVKGLFKGDNVDPNASLVSKISSGIKTITSAVNTAKDATAQVKSSLIQSVLPIAPKKPDPEPQVVEQEPEPIMPAPTPSFQTSLTQPTNESEAKATTESNARTTAPSPQEPLPMYDQVTKDTLPAPTQTTTVTTTGKTDPPKAEFMKEPGRWIKENPGKTVTFGVLGLAVIGGAIALARSSRNNKGKQGLNGIPRKRRRRSKRMRISPVDLE